MAELKRTDLNLSGIGSASGGVYQNVNVQGIGKVLGSLDCIRCNLEGVSEVTGDLHAVSLHLSGKVSVSGSLKAEEVHFQGSARVGGSCQAETFRSDGAFRINGLLTADKVDIRHERSSYVKEIGGEEIRVERGRSRNWFGRARCLTVEMVEGDDIYLEYTTARLVRGNRITLGPGVHIERVEYHTELRQTGKAQIGAKVQI